MIRGALVALAFSLMPLAGSGPEDTQPFEIALERHDAGTFYVRGRAGDGPETALLLDTGSTYVALTRETFEPIRRQAGVVHLRDVEGSMAAGRRLRVPVYRIPTLALGETCVLRDVEVAVIPGATRNILGLSALSQLQPITLSLAPPRLEFTSCPGAGVVPTP